MKTEFTKGMDVIVYDLYRPRAEKKSWPAKVKSVGSKYVTVDIYSHQNAKFHKDTGTQAGDWTHHQLFSLEGWALFEATDAAQMAMLKWGIDLRHPSPIGVLELWNLIQDHLKKKEGA